MKMREVWKVWRSSLPSEQKAVAAVLVMLAENREDIIYPSRQWIADACSISERSVTYCMAELRKLGVLTLVPGTQGGRAWFAHYTVEPDKLPFEATIPSSSCAVSDVKLAPVARDLPTNLAPVARDLDEKSATKPTTTASYGHSEERYIKALKPLQQSIIHADYGASASSGDEKATKEGTGDTRQPGELSPEMDTVSWMRKTWSDACQRNHRPIKFPRSMVAEILMAEGSFEPASFRVSWLSFLATGNFDVKVFLRRVGSGFSPRKVGSFRLPERASAASRSSPAVAAEQYARKPKVTDDEMLARVRDRYERTSGRKWGQ